MAKSRPKKKRRRRESAGPAPRSSLLGAALEAAGRQREAIAFALAFVHLFACLALLASTANIYSRPEPRVFGQTPSALSGVQEEADRREPSGALRVATVVYAAVTVCLWLAALVCHRTWLRGRPFRISCFILVPGTLAAVYMAVKLAIESQA